MGINLRKIFEAMDADQEIKVINIMRPDIVLYEGIAEAYPRKLIGQKWVVHEITLENKTKRGSPYIITVK